jgi:hypothetical protein
VVQVAEVYKRATLSRSAVQEPAARATTCVGVVELVSELDGVIAAGIPHDAHDMPAISHTT